jgi:feruloyl esterase
LAALDTWVEDGTAPENLVAQKFDPTSGTVAFERPLCEYPQYPRYTGPENDTAAARVATNYTCSQ